MVSQTDIGTVSKATLEYFQETGWNAYGLSRALGHNSERERTELLSCAHRKAPLTDTEGFGLQTERLWIGTPVLFTLKVVFFCVCGRDKESRSDVKQQLPWQLNKNTNNKHCPGKNHHMI